jgi:hypothetical protein
MERMIPQEFRHWFARFSRPRAIWIQHSGWVPGTQRSPVPEATAQGHMEDIVVEWAAAILRVRGQAPDAGYHTLADGSCDSPGPCMHTMEFDRQGHPVDLGYMSLPAETQADIENQMGEARRLSTQDIDENG